ncbi:hypothetical protein JI435_304100 [Parastagonospora nodorum SN15]|uniref:Uncharacterized protein n=1 Tax=Phaeosphaeria nodorum (strain SN15 / ATCC MYA-4574 / FGSC 10173) TaxID=321614 RepID=A0A7U2EZV0_PHANO|nr:hypothetical protein HBH54_165770 [Parastagonospora nodorum]KAH4625716.1 hypothetical protein HBH55_130870 [Parastagonospora nodorum]KAH4631604.1 hypothetical protein HBH81_150950 [Parastagonospora nodorum]QRC96131.1 hypothetical protein JI435_304100 [Parastagonospora nodorum SN15]
MAEMDKGDEAGEVQAGRRGPSHLPDTAMGMGTVVGTVCYSLSGAANWLLATGYWLLATGCKAGHFAALVQLLHSSLGPRGMGSTLFGGVWWCSTRWLVATSHDVLSHLAFGYGEAVEKK